MPVCVPIASVVTMLPFICIVSSRSGIAVISLLFFRTALCPIQKPSSLLHAETICSGFSFLFLFPRIVFPSMQTIFLRASPSPLSRSPCHFTYSCCSASGETIPITLCIVSCDGTQFSSPVYFFK